jgi:hypothetical protein
MKDRRAK